MAPRLRTVAILLLLAGLALGVFTSRALRALRPSDLLADPTRANSPQIEQLVDTYQRAYQLDAREADAIRQELRRYDFPPDAAARPIFGPDEAAAGITARDLPNFMAMAVTSEMLRQGLIDEVEESKPQNVCARKLWERMILNESVRPGTS